MRWILLIALLTVPVGAAAASEDELAAAREAARKADMEEAMGLLEEMFDQLERLTRFGFVAQTGYDALQETGQKLEFGGRRRFLVRRPDRMRVEATRRDGERATLFFDGRRISMDLPLHDAYATVDKQGSLDEAIDYLEEGLDEPVPLLNLAETEMYAELVPRIRYALVVGDATIDGVPCDHLAFQGEEVDFQLWLRQGERPLPMRIVIDYKREPGRPQFRARLSEWDLVPDARDVLFDYTPPDGAERIPFAPPARDDLARTGGR